MHYIVISKYTEPLDPLIYTWSRNPGAYTVIIYDKGPPEKSTKKHIHLPNVGREAHTFARACVDVYDCLQPNDIVTFLQAGFRDHTSSVDAVLHAPKHTMYIPLAYTLYTCNIHGQPHHNGLRLDLAKPRLESIVGISLPKTTFTFAPGAQYTVRAPCIRQHSKESWETLTRVLGREYSIGTHDHDGIDPWQMERFWMYVFETKQNTV